MKGLIFFNWLKNVSLTRKLYFVVGIMAVLIAIELFMLSFMIHTLSSTRALVGAEGLWSKAEKDAVYNLLKYGYTHNEKDYKEYESLLKVPVGDHKARVELTKPQPDYDIVRQGFREGRFNEDDIDGTIKMLRRFHNISYISKAITIWADGDKYLDQLEYLGSRLHVQISAGDYSNPAIGQTLEEIHTINGSLTLLEDEFSYTLGEGSRWVEHLVLGILFFIAMTVEFSGLFLTISVSRGISKGINEIIRISGNIASADFSSRAKVYSKDEIGQLAGSFNSMIDDLQHKREEETMAREELKRQKDVYESLITAQSEMGEGVCITEGEKILYVNDAICKMYGYTKEEMLAMPSFLHVVPEPERLLLVERLKQRISGERDLSAGETKILRKDGTVIDVEYTVRNFFSENRQQMISIIRDVTEKKKSEIQLRNEKERAESAEVAKKIGEQFLANMSHEIRTPMNAIIGFTEILEKSPLTREQRQYLDAIKVSGDNLLVIINDILDFSRMRSGKMPIEHKEFRLSQILSSCKNLMQPKAEEKKLEIITTIQDTIPDNLAGDPTRLLQVLLNLTANAIKFTEQGSVSIIVNLLDNENNKAHLQFLVADTGIGIPAEQLSTIFDAFIQANNHTARKYGGTGLGLAIVKQLAELQGGSVSVSSKPGEGSCFDFRITYDVAMPEVEQQKQSTFLGNKVELKDLNILLAEDNTMNQLLAKKILNDWGWKVEIAENGEDAIETLKQKDFDLVLMDIQLPEMDGYEATRFIRNKLPNSKRKVPIIAMTACVMEGEEERCKNAGMDGYVSKPFNSNTLYNKIASVIK